MERPTTSKQSGPCSWSRNGSARHVAGVLKLDSGTVQVLSRLSVRSKWAVAKTSEPEKSSPWGARNESPGEGSTALTLGLLKSKKLNTEAGTWNGLLYESHKPLGSSGHLLRHDLRGTAGLTAKSSTTGLNFDCGSFCTTAVINDLPGPTHLIFATVLSSRQMRKQTWREKATCPEVSKLVRGRARLRNQVPAALRPASFLNH